MMRLAAAAHRQYEDAGRKTMLEVFAAITRAVKNKKSDMKMKAPRGMLSIISKEPDTGIVQFPHLTILYRALNMTYRRNFI
jgi:hypothetical protein